MSTDYRLLNNIPACNLFDGCLDAFGVLEHVKPDETTEKTRCLTDGRNYVWVYIDDDGLVALLSRYGANAPQKILNAVAEVFDTDIVSEYEPEFWGFDTQEEWDAAWTKMAKETEEKYYTELLKYLRGQPNNIQPGTVGMVQAEIAKTLVENDPTLLLSENKAKLHDKVNSIYERDHTVKVTLDPEQMALVKMMATHEDDLPKA